MDTHCPAPTNPDKLTLNRFFLATTVGFIEHACTIGGGVGVGMGDVIGGGVGIGVDVGRGLATFKVIFIQ